MTAPIRLPVVEIISYAEAKARGLKRYFTGKACKHGHICERTVSSGCVRCRRIKDFDEYWNKGKREKKLKWFRDNKEKVKQQPSRKKSTGAYQRERYWKNVEASRQKFRKYAKLRREKKREHCLAYEKQWREKNREQRRSWFRAYHYNGPSNPKGEKSWLRKNKVMLRNLRRLLQKPNLDHSHLLSEDQRR